MDMDSVFLCERDKQWSMIDNVVQIIMARCDLTSYIQVEWMRGQASR